MTATPSNSFQPEAIPAELKNQRQWVVWKLVQRQGKATKVPYDAKNGGPGATDKSETWTSFEDAVARVAKGGFSGIGFVFTSGDPYVGVDLDHCRDDQTGETLPWAKAIIDSLNSYTEISQSGTGIHIILKGHLPGTKKKKTVDGGGAIEMYDKGRYFTMTGNKLEGTSDTISERGAELAELHSKTFGESESPVVKPKKQPAIKETHSVVGQPISAAPQMLELGSARMSPPGTDDDEVLLRKARNAQNGEKFAALFDRGDLSEYGGDPSKADFALCSRLAFWTGKDSERIDRLFRRSALMRPKWDEPRPGGTYGSMTIEKAMKSFDGPNEKPGSDQTEKATAKPKLRSWKEITESTTEDLHYVVDGLIPEGGVALLIARQKAGKSMLASQMSIDVSEGKPFLDVLATQQGKVLYLDFENRPQILKARGKDLGQNREITNVYFACYDRISDRELGLDGRNFEKLKQNVAELKPRLLVIDPLRLATSTDTNDALKVVALMDNASKLLAINPDMGILILHHLKKQQEQRGNQKLRLRDDPQEWTDRVHGSQALLAHVETIIGLEQDEEDLFTLATVARSSSPIMWALEKAPGSQRFVLASGDSQLKTWTKKQQEHWKELPPEFTRTEGDELVGHSTCDRLIRKALPLGMLEQDKNTKKYRKTHADTQNRGTSGIFTEKEEVNIRTENGTKWDSLGPSSVPSSVPGVPEQSQFAYQG